MQNLWQNKGILLHRQIRRSQVVKKCLNNKDKILDIGCAEGFTTSYISNNNNLVIGIELNMEYLKLAQKKVKGAIFINGSIDYLPFKDNYFDAVSILEVLEHLPIDLQQSGLKESSRVLNKNGTMVISVPYKEERVFTRCIHCYKETPLWGHLHSLDENNITSLLPHHAFTLKEKYNLPHLFFVSCLSIFKFLPISLWLKFNDILGKFKFQRGYWMILKYLKT